MNKLEIAIKALQEVYREELKYVGYSNITDIIEKAFKELNINLEDE